MAAINLAYLEFRLSGGAANTDPDASLGGILSSQRIYSKSATGISNITGVTVDDAPGSANGAGTLAWDDAEELMTWTPNGGTAGEPVLVTEDGRYAIPGSTGYLCITVDYSELPGSNQSDTITVGALSNELFDNISKPEAYDGDVEYRAFYAFNAHPTDPFIGCKVYIGTQPNGADSLKLALDAAGIGDGGTTGIADTVINENTAPDDLTFAAPSAIGSAITIGQLDAGEAQAIWMERTVPALTLTSVLADTSALVFNIGY
jgi:hypothetical protein